MPGYRGDFGTEDCWSEFKRLLLITESQISQVDEFRASLFGKMQKSGLADFSAPVGGQHPVFSRPWCPQGSLAGRLQGPMPHGGLCRHPVSILSPLRAHCQGGCNAIGGWLQHPLFTDTAGNLFFTPSTKSTHG